MSLLSLRWSKAEKSQTTFQKAVTRQLGGGLGGWALRWEVWGWLDLNRF